MNDLNDLVFKKTSKDMMRSMRESWREVGFVENNVRSHVADKEVVLAVGQLLMGLRIVQIIEDGGDEAMDLALTISERHRLKGSVTLHELTLWKEQNKNTKDRMALVRYDEVFEAMMEQMKHSRVAENAEAHMQANGPTAEKYEEAAIARGLFVGWNFIANGKWRMLKEGRWVNV